MSSQLNPNNEPWFIKYQTFPLHKAYRQNLEHIEEAQTKSKGGGGGITETPGPMTINWENT